MEFTKRLNNINIPSQLTEKYLLFHSLLVYIFLYVPILVVIVLSFTDRRIPAFPIDGLTIHWYLQLIPPDYNEALVFGLFRSLGLGIIAAVLAAIVGTIAALGMVRGEYDYANTSTLNVIFTSPLMVPWIVIGVAVLILFNVIGITGTFGSLIIGHTLITFPFVVLVVSNQLMGLDRSLEESAMNLGATELRTFYEITLPLVAPGIIAGMLFAFTFSFDNFVQTFFWAPRDFQTLPLVIHSQIEFGLTPTVNAISAIVVVFSMGLAFTAERLVRFYT